MDPCCTSLALHFPGQRSSMSHQQRTNPARWASGSRLRRPAGRRAQPQQWCPAAGLLLLALLTAHSAAQGSAEAPEQGPLPGDTRQPAAPATATPATASKPGVEQHLLNHAPLLQGQEGVSQARLSPEQLIAQAAAIRRAAAHESTAAASAAAAPQQPSAAAASNAPPHVPRTVAGATAAGMVRHALSAGAAERLVRSGGWRDVDTLLQTLESDPSLRLDVVSEKLHYACPAAEPEPGAAEGAWEAPGASAQQAAAAAQAVPPAAAAATHARAAAAASKGVRAAAAAANGTRAGAAAEWQEDDPALLPVPVLSEAFTLHSRPGAKHVLIMDFTGEGPWGGCAYMRMWVAIAGLGADAYVLHRRAFCTSRYIA